MAAGRRQDVPHAPGGPRRAEAGRDVVIGLLETHGRAETAAAGRRARGRAAARASIYRGTTLERDGPPRHPRAARPSCAWSTSSRTPTRPGSSTRSATRTSRTCSTPASTCSRRSTSSTSSRSTTRSPSSAASRVRETVPDRCSAAPTRSCSSTSPPRRCSRACAPARSTRPSASTPRSTASSGSRTSPRCARSRCARWPRRSRPSGWSTEVVGTREDTLAADLPQAVGERLLALVEPYPGAQRLVRRAWRSAQRLGADLDVLWVAPPGREPDPEQERQLGALRQLASVLGAHLIVEPGDDVADDRRAGRPRARHHLHPPRPLAPGARPRARCASRSPSGSCEALPGVDVRIVADRSLRHEKTP